MSRRTEIMIDEDPWGISGRIPAGERSRTINEALREWVARRRTEAAHEVDALRVGMPKVSSDELAKWIRHDREQGH